VVAEGRRTLLVGGGKDGYIRPPAALAALMPDAEPWYVSGLYHCCQRKVPALHVRMVEAWCTGQELSSELRHEPTPRAEAVDRPRRKVAAFTPVTAADQSPGRDDDAGPPRIESPRWIVEQFVTITGPRSSDRHGPQRAQAWDVRRTQDRRECERDGPS
jgi:hypothetical protein